MPSTSFSDDLRQARSQAVVTTLGNGAKLEGWSGTKPASVTGSFAGCAKLETFTFTGVPIGTVNSVGLLDFSETAGVCDNTQNVTGTRTFVVIRNASNVIKIITDQLSGGTSVVNGVTSNLSNISIVDGNP